MKRQIKETSIMGKRGPQRVITYGYNTEIDGLDVIRITKKDIIGYTPIHTKSGLSVSVCFTSATKAIRFANKYLKDFDFTQDKNNLLRDGKLKECVHDAKVREEAIR